MSAKSKGLGRGLSALLAEVDADSTVAEPSQKSNTMLPIEKIRPNPEQPRRDFLQEDLDDLAASIRAKGIIQPLIVRVDPGDQNFFQIVAGERRWRAAQLAQVHELPVLVREFDDTEVLEIAIIENIQRADLNPVEEAAGYKQLMEKFGHTQEKLAHELGKSRSHIANLMRLLNLPSDVLQLLRTGKLSAGHARALVPAENPSYLAQEIVAKGLSVRQAEALAKKKVEAPKAPKRSSVAKDADTKAIESDLSAQLSMGVSIDPAPNGQSGSMTIKYRNLDQLDALLQLLSQQPRV